MAIHLDTDVLLTRRPTHPVVLRRTASASKIPELAKGVLETLEADRKKREQEEIDQKQGQMWRCDSYRPNALGGRIYQFSMKKQSKEAGNKKNMEIFPAIELHQEKNLTIFGTELFKMLGYSIQSADNELKLSLPDQEALERNWENFRICSNRYIPPLQIQAGDDDAVPEEFFIQSNIQGVICLSPKMHFLHDQMLHIAPTLRQLLCEPQNRYPVVKLFLMGYRTLYLAKEAYGQLEPYEKTPYEPFQEKYEIARTLLTIFIDIATSNPNKILKFGTTALRQTIMNLQRQMHWRRYLRNKFPHQNFISCWDTMQALENRSDEKRNQNLPPQPLVTMDLRAFRRSGKKIELQNQVYTLTNMGYTDHNQRRCLLETGDSICVLVGKEHIVLEDAYRLYAAPSLIVVACRFAQLNNRTMVVVENANEEWPLYFQLGFRLPAILEDWRDAFLIEYAQGVGLLTPDEIELLNRIALLNQEILEPAQRIYYTSIDKTREELIPLAEGKSALFHTAVSLVHTAPSLQFHANYYQNNLLNSEISDLPIAVTIGNILLKEELNNLRRRMAFIEEEFLSEPSLPFCDIL
ncbi:MAG: hypothetical protein ACK5MA_00740 [Parachlamydiaceae bacterium]